MVLKLHCSVTEVCWPLKYELRTSFLNSVGEVIQNVKLDHLRFTYRYCSYSTVWRCRRSTNRTSTVLINQNLTLIICENSQQPTTTHFPRNQQQLHNKDGIIFPQRPRRQIAPCSAVHQRTFVQAFRLLSKNSKKPSRWRHTQSRTSDWGAHQLFLQDLSRKLS